MISSGVAVTSLSDRVSQAGELLSVYRIPLERSNPISLKSRSDLINAHLDQPEHRPHGCYSSPATCARRQSLATRMLPPHYNTVERQMSQCSSPDSILRMTKMVTVHGKILRNKNLWILPYKACGVLLKTKQWL